MARATDVVVVDLEDLGRHYAEILRRWAKILENRAFAIKRLGVRDEFLRLWTLYLAKCGATFLERHVSDVQVVLANPGWRGSLTNRVA